jgi:hypothetical protein
MALIAEPRRARPEHVALGIRAVGVVAEIAHAVGHRLMDYLSRKHSPVMAVPAEIGDAGLNQILFLRIVRVVTGNAHPCGHRSVPGVLLESLPVVAGKAYFRGGHVQQKLVFAGVRIVALTAGPRHDTWVYRGMNKFLAYVLFLGVTCEADLSRLFPEQRANFRPMR